MLGVDLEMRTTLTALLILVATLTCQAQSELPIGFEHKSQLLRCLPGDTTRLTTSGGQKCMQWDLVYKPGQFRMLTKTLKPGELKGMKSMSLWIKSGAPGPLWWQLRESSGETYYKVLNPTSSWKTVQFSLAKLELNTDKVVNGKLDLAQVTKIEIFDAAQRTGQRRIFLADWSFQGSGKVAAQTKRPSTASRGRSAKIGITGVPRNYRETEAGWLEVFTRAKKSGATLLGAGAEWNDNTEIEPGRFQWRALETYFDTLKKHRYRFEISLDVSGPFWQAQLKKPSHVKANSLADTALLKRYKAMVTSLLDRYGRRCAYLTINAEGASQYFRAHPDQLDDYLRFLDSVKRHVKHRSPHLKFGVNTDPHNSDEVLRAIAKKVDFLALDVTSIEGHVDQPEDLASLVDRLLQVAGGKKIAFQNVWWSTSEVESSSEQQQQTFVKELFRVLESHHRRFEYIILYTMFDEDFEFMRPLYKARFPDLPPAYVEKMLQSNGRSGLFRHDLTPKPAWGELREQISGYKARHPR